MIVGHIRFICLFVLHHFSALPVSLSNPSVRLSFWGVSALGIIDYRNCHQLFLRWRLKILIWCNYQLIFFFYSFKNKFICINTSDFFPYYYRLHMCESLPWFHILFFHRYMLSPCILVWPLTIINDFVWGIFLINITVTSIFFI